MHLYETTGREIEKTKCTGWRGTTVGPRDLKAVFPQFHHNMDSKRGENICPLIVTPGLVGYHSMNF